MNAKYWLFAATLFGTACLEAEDDKDEESEPSVSVLILHRTILVMLL